MKHVVHAIIPLGLGLMPPLATAQAVLDEPSAAVRSCISGNAANIEKVFESLTEGADYLVLKVCGDVIAEQVRAANIEQQRKQRQEQAAKRDEMCAKRDTADTDRINNPMSPQHYLTMMCENPAMDMMTESAELYFDATLFSTANAPKAGALAAKTLLDLRVKRLGAKP